jgi:hypothetical protein
MYKQAISAEDMSGAWPVCPVYARKEQQCRSISRQQEYKQRRSRSICRSKVELQCSRHVLDLVGDIAEREQTCTWCRWGQVVTVTRIINVRDTGLNYLDARTKCA